MKTIPAPEQPHFRARPGALRIHVQGPQHYGVGAKAPKTYEPNRVCEHPDCTTKLSIYNRQSKCHIHRDVRFPRVRGREQAKR